MKLAAITLLACIAAVCAAPTSISDNNIGDIVTVDLNANLTLDNNIQQNIFSVIAALLNQQSVVAGSPNIQGADGKSAEIPKLPEFPITPEIVAKVKDALAQVEAQATVPAQAPVPAQA